MARWELWHLVVLLVPVLVVLHLFVSPYTKVEESFNIQATHDILAYGVPTKNVYRTLKVQYDHMTFPGAVPRTFIGSLTLAGVANLFISYWQLDGEQQQVCVRAILGLFNAVALMTYAYGVTRAFGKDVALWYTLLQLSQFHVFYYASRTLPNMFAFGISTFALRSLLPDMTSSMSPVKRTRLAIYLLSLAAIIFRSEIALLLASQCLYILLKSPTMATRLSLIRSALLPAVLTATVAGLVLTVSIDTFFWQSSRLLWPEMAAFLSNIFPSKDSLGASAWGTSPWYWYFTSAIPRLLGNPQLLCLIAYGLLQPALQSSMLDLLVPSLLYVALYSFLPHKETRFLFPIIPPLTAAVALPASFIANRSARYTLAKFATTILLASTIVTSFISHTLLLPLSAQTYPGASALAAVHASAAQIWPPPSVINIHLTNLALQTGVTRFLQYAPPETNSETLPIVLLGSPDGSHPTLTSGATHYIYDKSDNASEYLTPEFWARFHYVIVEDPIRVIGGPWDVVDKITGLGSPKLIGPDTGRGLIVLGSEDQDSSLKKSKRRREEDGMSRLVGSMYGSKFKWIYGVLHDIIREGYGMDKIPMFDKILPTGSWTAGWWVHWGLETKLYVLKKGVS